MIYYENVRLPKNMQSKSSVVVNLLCNFTLGKSFPGSASWDRAHRSDKLGHRRAQALQLVLQMLLISPTHMKLHDEQKKIVFISYLN